MRKRKLYVSELLGRYKTIEQITQFVIWYKDNGVSYESIYQCINNLSGTELWNLQVKKWTVQNNIIIIHI